jgi:hypothetical protein
MQAISPLKTGNEKLYFLGSMLKAKLDESGAASFFTCASGSATRSLMKINLHEPHFALPRLFPFRNNYPYD